jgi:hypothetical protein
MKWLEERRHRYKNQRILDFEQVRESARTGDIILFHKTARTGFLDALELDIVSPLLFKRNEFRHCGIVVRREDGSLDVLECADAHHSGHEAANYVTSGNGIRVVSMEPLLAAYKRDNGNPHFGIKHIASEIPLPLIQKTLDEYRAIDYLKVHKTIRVLLSHYLLPHAYDRFVEEYSSEMMCSEFMHSFLNRCGVLKNYPSKVFMPYYIEDDERFKSLEIVSYSDIVRFDYQPAAISDAA